MKPNKKKQSFSREKATYKLDEKKDVLVKLDETVDLQAEMNSHYDETLFYNLERFYEASNVDVLDEVDGDDFNGLDDLTGSNADIALRALLHVDELRDRYEIPDTISNTELLQLVRERAASKPAETNVSTKGGVNDETQTQTE